MKKYVITGSLGHISKPLVAALVNAGHNVSVITRHESNAMQIKALGATPLVGSVYDVEFLRRAFQGNDAVYTMVPPLWETNHWRASQNEVGRNYADALQNSGVRFVVNLSSVGAHLRNGCGPVDGIADVEKMLNQLQGVHVKHLRPSFFYYNFLSQIPLINQAGIFGANYGEPGKKFPLVHPADIAKAAASELLQLNFTGNSVRYVLSDITTAPDVAATLGLAIGKNLPWVVFTDQQQKEGLLQAGLSETHAQGYTDMGTAIRSGRMFEEILQHAPEPGAVTLKDFAKEFKEAYEASLSPLWVSGVENL